jgi:hypothetical protein
MPRFTPENAATHGRKGGMTTVQRHGRAHMQRIGKQGFQATVQRHYAGDARAYVNKLIERGLAALDPVPSNGAWQPRSDGTVPDRLPKTWNPNV